MKMLYSYLRILTIFLWIYSVVTISQLNAQTIVIDSTFTIDGEIFPFSQNDTIYGLSISGSATLNSDTSLVRVILSDTVGNEWMVYEAYSLILPCRNMDLNNASDETKYLQVNSPHSIEIQIIDANLQLDSLFLENDYSENLESRQESYKQTVEANKVDSIRYVINSNDMLWFANQTPISNESYSWKKSLFGYKFNLQGLDYYTGGFFDPTPGVDGPVDNSAMIDSWDWRNRHGANDPEKEEFYYDGDTNGTGWLTSVKCQWEDPTCVSLCYIYGPLAAIEGAANLFFNHSKNFLDYDLSEENILDCDSQTQGDCTDGGQASETLFKVKMDGVVDEQCYPNDTIVNNCLIDSLSSGCPTHLIKISYGLVTGSPSNNEIKENIITKGPLCVKLSNYSGGKPHFIVLIGYQVLKAGDIIHITPNDTIIVNDSSEYIGQLAWIFKNSWGTGYGEKGFMIHLNSNYHPPTPMYYISSIDDTLTENDTIEPKDLDHDGYWNWGISENFTLPGYACSDVRDSDDSENRLGPFDTNYYSIPIMPEIVVTNRWKFNADTIKNGGYYYFEGDTINDTTLTFYISNPGTAQLNLVQYNLTDSGLVTIEYQNPPEQYEIPTSYLPEKSICMFDDTTSFKIKLKQGAEDGSLALVQIHVNEPDMDSIFEFTLVFNGCETEPGYDSVNTVVSWSDSCRTQNKDLHIQRDGVLTISGTVLLSPEADIIVEQGGKLIIDGGKLTRSCEDELWNGIQVWGDSSLSQYPDTNQGFVQIKNNGCIEYARTGIFTGRFDNEEALYNYSGGIVVAEEAIFLNNEVDVEFLPFINDHPSSLKEIDNFSGFRRCTFKTLDPDLVLHAPIAHAILDGVSGIDFSACTFTTQEVPGHPFEDDDKGTGILLYDSHIYVKTLCSTPVIPCEEYDSCCFTNLRYGIRAFNTGANKFFSVREAIFDGNIAGIYLSGYHQSEILSSYFYSCLENEQMQGIHDPFYGGLYLDGSTGYHIENNLFTGPYTELPDSGYIAKIGIYVKDSGDDDNEIYNNFFTGLDAGIVAEGINKGDSTGLCLKCNDFRTCLNDMLVFEGDTTGRYIGIKENQGADDTLSTSLAGNTFTSEYQEIKATDKGGNYKYYWSYFNEVDNISYYHHDEHLSFITYPSDSNITKETITLYNKGIDYEKEQACPSGLNNNHYKNYSDPRLEISEANSQLLPLRNNYGVLLDGGNTDELDFEIVTSLPDDALELRQQLLADSPYLSDTIMKQAIYKENVLPNAMIRDVLSANPQAAKSDDILDAVDGRYDPMPDYMMADIMQGLEQIGALESLESKIGYWNQFRSRAVNRLIREYLTDSTIIDREDSLINLFQNESTLQSKYRLAFTYWEGDQVNDALGVLDDIPTTFDLTYAEQNIHQDYLDYFSILQMMVDSNLNARDLDSSSVQSLLSIINDGQPLISAYARGMLLKGRHIDYVETVAFPSGVKSYPAYYYLDPPQFEFSEEDHLVLFPNPTGDYIITYFNYLNLGEPGTLVIDNIQGQRVAVIKLESEQNQLVIDLSKFSNGLYFVSLIINKKLIESEKLIKGRY